jgi:hypothetical protein
MINAGGRDLPGPQLPRRLATSRYLVLFLAHEDMNSTRQKPWPLVKADTMDVFNPVALFTDQRNRWIKLTLAYTSG